MKGSDVRSKQRTDYEGVDLTLSFNFIARTVEVRVLL